MLLTACDDMHSHLYDVEHASLIEAFSGASLPSTSISIICPAFSSNCLPRELDEIESVLSSQVMSRGS